MKIYTYIRFDIFTLEVIEEESFEYNGPLALCWGDPGDADEGGNYGHDSDSNGGGIESSYEQEDADAGSALSDRGGVGDDPSVPDSFWSALGYNQYSWNKAFEDQPDIMRNYAGEIMSRVGAFAVAFATLVGFKGAVDPFGTYDVFQDILSGLMGGKWTSYSYNDFADLGDYATTGMGDGIGGTENYQAFLNDTIGIRLGNGPSVQQDPTQSRQLQQQYIQLPAFNKWVSTPKPVEEKEVVAGPVSPYSMFNFPPITTGDMYSQPKTSIWYV